MQKMLHTKWFSYHLLLRQILALRHTYPTMTSCSANVYKTVMLWAAEKMWILINRYRGIAVFGWFRKCIRKINVTTKFALRVVKNGKKLLKISCYLSTLQKNDKNAIRCFFMQNKKLTNLKNNLKSFFNVQISIEKRNVLQWKYRKLLILLCSKDCIKPNFHKHCTFYIRIIYLKFILFFKFMPNMLEIS